MTTTIKSTATYLSTEQVTALKKAFFAIAVTECANQPLGDIGYIACTNLENANETIANRAMRLRAYADELMRSVEVYGHANCGTPTNLTEDIAAAKAEGYAAMQTVLRCARKCSLTEA